MSSSSSPSRSPSAAKASEDSGSTGRASSTRNPARSASAIPLRHRVVLPIPASLSSTSAPGNACDDRRNSPPRPRAPLPGRPDPSRWGDCSMPQSVPKQPRWPISSRRGGRWIPSMIATSRLVFVNSDEELTAGSALARPQATVRGSPTPISPQTLDRILTYTQTVGGVALRWGTSRGVPSPNPSST